MRALVPKSAPRTVATTAGADIVPAVIADAGDHLKPSIGGAPAHHTIGVDPVHRLVGQHAGPADRRAEEGVLSSSRMPAAARYSSVKLGCHVFRATGITAYLEAGGTLENAQAMAAHESPRTTKLYDRTGDEITLDEVERITI